MGKFLVAVAIAVSAGSGTALADDPVGSVPTPVKCLPIIGCPK